MSDSAGMQMDERLESVTNQRTWSSQTVGRVRLRLYNARLRGWWWLFRQRHRLKKRFGLLPDAADRRIVIGLGMHRTGTKSLCEYLRNLGLRDIHWPWWCDRQVSGRVDDPEGIVDVMEPLFYNYDCFADCPFPGLYRVLDRRFPNSRFILVRRDPASWVRSVQKHWKLETGAYRLHPFEEAMYRRYEPSDMNSLTMDDVPSLVTKFAKHAEEVQAYFAGKGDKLLVVDLEDARINERISGFLDMPVRPYPHA